MFSWQAISVTLQIVQFMMLVAVSVYGWIAAKRRATLAELERLSGRVDHIEHRVITTEGDIAHLPRSSDFSELKTEVAALRAEVKGQNHWLERIDSYLHAKS